MEKFFPEYLNQGATDRRAVTLLQYFLLFGGYNRDIVADGDYGNQTAIGVERLQRELGFTGVDVDGNFGPKTREALWLQKGIEINKIPTDAFNQ